MPRVLVVEADGGSRGNPGPAASGSAVIDAATGQVLTEAGRYLGVATNNVAEYHGLLEGVRRARAIDPDARLRVRMDSKLVVEQMSGRWKIKHPDMAALAAKVRAELAGCDVTFEWVPRLHNSRADALVNLALDARADVGGADAGGADAAPRRRQPSTELAELLEVEQLLRDPATDPAIVQSLLQADFWTIDASGAALTRDDALASLAASDPLPFEPADAVSRQLAPGLHQLSYTLTRRRDVIRCTSLWRRTAAGWQLLFQQVTPLEQSGPRHP
jgi:ribonuclease HI